MRTINPDAWPLSSFQVMLVLDISRRQLQWWDEQGVVKPHIEGHSRRYTAVDVQRAAVVAQLRSAGLSLQIIRGLLKKHSVSEWLENSSEAVLLTNGRTVEFLALSEIGCRLLEVQPLPHWRGRIVAVRKRDFTQ